MPRGPRRRNAADNDGAWETPPGLCRAAGACDSGVSKTRPQPPRPSFGRLSTEHLAQSQYWSAEITSPPARVPNAHQTCGLMVDLTNRTLPSQKRTFTPPGCRLLAVKAPLGWYPVSYSQLQVLGGMTWV